MIYLKKKVFEEIPNFFNKKEKEFSDYKLHFFEYLLKQLVLKFAIIIIATINDCLCVIIL